MALESNAPYTSAWWNVRSVARFPACAERPLHSKPLLRYFCIENYLLSVPGKEQAGLIGIPSHAEGHATACSWQQPDCERRLIDWDHLLAPVHIDELVLPISACLNHHRPWFDRIDVHEKNCYSVVCQSFHQGSNIFWYAGTAIFRIKIT